MIKSNCHIAPDPEKHNKPSGLCTSEVQESTNDIFVNRISSRTGQHPTFDI